MRWFHAAKKTLVLGTGPLVAELLAEVANQPNCEYQVIGIVAEQARAETEFNGYALLGALKDVRRVILEQQPEVIIVSLSLGTVCLSDHRLLDTDLLRNVHIEHIATVYERLTGKLPIEAYAPEDVIFSDTFRPDGSALMLTRLLSLVVALLGSVIFAPLMLLIAVLLKLDSRGPLLFVQERTGFKDKPFKLFKFRTMVPEKHHVSEWAEDNKARITPVGHWLRKYRLDELPQFFNILKGEMNLVGPRPHPASNADLFVLVARNLSDSGTQIPYYALRSSVRPGITGWAQVRYQYANNLQEEIEKLRFDLYYLKHYSLWLDLRILLETVRVVFGGHIVPHKAEAETAKTTTTSTAEERSSTYAKP